MAQPSIDTSPTGAASSHDEGLREIPRTSLLERLDWLRRFRNDALTLTRSLHRKYGSVVLQDVRIGRTVNLFGPDANRFLLVDAADRLSAKRSWEAIMGQIFGGGVMLRDGDDHKHHRRIMQVAFRQGALKGYLERMHPLIDDRVEEWSRGRALLAFPAIKRLTLLLAWEIFVGESLDGEETGRLNHAFEAEVAASMSLIRLPIPGLEFHEGRKGRRALSDYFRSRIPDRRATESPDMLSRLCHAESDEGERFSDTEIVDHMNFLMMAAHDTTTSTLTSMAYQLAVHPEWQERVREECRSLGPEPLQFDDQPRLETLGRVFRETLRRHPPLSTIPRVATEDLAFDGHRIPEGSLVAIFPIHTHHMEAWWRDPFRFDPDRFSDERGEHKQHSHLWVPFGGGPHTCLGLRFAEMQVKAIVHRLVQRVRWTVPDGYEMPIQEAPISKPRDGLPLLIEPLD